MFKLIPFLTVPVLAGGFVVSTYGSDKLLSFVNPKPEQNMEDVDVPSLDLGNDDTSSVVATPVSKPAISHSPVNLPSTSNTPVPFGSAVAGFKYVVSGAQEYYSKYKDVSDGNCRLYVIQRQNVASSFEYESHVEYPSLDSLPKDVKVNRMQTVKCRDNKHFYIYRPHSFSGTWNVRVSDSAPVQQKK